MTQDQMLAFYNRTYTKANKDLPLPSYLKKFTPQEKDEDEELVFEFLRRLKDNSYDISKEEE